MAHTDHNADTHRELVQQLRDSGQSATALGQEYVAKHGALHQYVDPMTRGATRESRSVMEEVESGWALPKGVALPVLTGFDGTGSMTINIGHAFHAGPEFHRLLTAGEQPIANRYHLQVASSVVQDVSDSHPLCLSEFEAGNEFVEQHRLLVPDDHGYNRGAEYQILLYFAGCRTTCDIWRYGLKGYLHVVGDERGHDLGRSDVKHVLDVDLEREMPAEEVGRLACQKWHPTYFQVDNSGRFLDYATEWWSRAIGRENVVLVGSAEYVAYWQVATIGLQEGILGLETLGDYLTSVAGLENRREVERICHGLSHIPVRAQADLPNFDRLPLAGSVFASREDLWPIGSEDEEVVAVARAAGGDTAWQL